MPFPRSGTFRSGTFRSGTFRSGTFHSGSFRPGSFRPGSFRPDAFPPRHFLSRHFLSRHFLSRHFSAPSFCFAAALLSRVFAAPRGRGMLVREGKTHVWEGKVPRLSEKEGDGARWGRQGARPGGRLLARPGVWLSARQGREGRWVGRKSGSDRCGAARSEGRAPGCRRSPAGCISGGKVACGAGVEAR